MANVTPGGTIPLTSVYRDAAGALVDPTTPTISILDPASAVVVAPLAPTRASLGMFSYPGAGYAVPGGAALGTWTARWMGVVGGIQVGPVDETFTVVAALPGAYTWEPTPADVAALLPQRTGDATGRASGAFSASTVPTDTMVSGLIDGASAELIPFIGANPDAAITAMAKHALALLAASYVERSFYPDASGSAYSPAAQLLARFDKVMAEIDAAQSGAGEEIGPPMPRWVGPDSSWLESTDNIQRPFAIVPGVTSGLGTRWRCDDGTRGVDRGACRTFRPLARRGRERLLAVDPGL